MVPGFLLPIRPLYLRTQFQRTACFLGHNYHLSQMPSYHFIQIQRGSPASSRLAGQTAQVTTQATGLPTRKVKLGLVPRQFSYQIRKRKLLIFTDQCELYVPQAINTKFWKQIMSIFLQMFQSICLDKEDEQITNYKFSDQFLCIICPNTLQKIHRHVCNL